ncbi:PEP-utilizing enzyme [Arthrobacter sp. I2-34]|uniref:PEP-utilizing enzyme n=1 Tax=Arthrobacter hankyongi TaxID=2904801 RepID=A0ABS9L2L0_9MICC|nr:PEP/pyruvate-binding domain-containing protein [Arthrobacter hankyongi]MCG2620737.1 PEP-utilizing enzyme [Arthrobacter hankyongi]
MDVPSHDQLVIELSRIGAGMLPEVGGKSLNLGILMASGLPVPGGFCLTTAAYRSMAEAIGLEGPVEAVEQLDAADLPGLADAAGHVREAVLAAVLPDRVAREVRAAYAELGPDVPVAVRSSATAEDLPEASFAGQQDTFLNVSGAEAVLDAVRRCWASLWTDRAVAYRAAHGIGQHQVSIAVVVQEMVPAAAAGVLFTANPVTGTRHQAVVDAGPGLGDAVVSGAVNPDHYVVDTATGRVLQRRLADRAGGNGQGCLTDAQLRELTALGAKAEDAFGSPQDLEWAVDGDGTLWLTQSRGITTLYPVPEGWTPAKGHRVYLCVSLAQGLMRPLTPMGMAAIGNVRNASTGWRMAEAGLRPFVDLTPVVRSRSGRRTMLRMFRLAEARSAALLQGLYADPRFATIEGSRSPNILTGTGARQIVPILLRILEAAVSPEAALRRVQDVGRQLEQRLQLAEPATPAERLDFVARNLTAAFTTLVPSVLPAPATGFAMLGLARWLLRGIAEPGELQVVLRGLPHNVTTEMDLQLWQLSTEVRQDPESVRVLAAESAAELSRRYLAGTLPTALQERLASFLVRYGHRAVAEIDLGLPRWFEDPAHLLGVIANYLRVDSGQPTPDVQFAQAAAQAEDKVRDLTARARLRRPGGRLRAAAVGFCLRRTRQEAGLREQPKFYIIQAFAALRRQLNAVGEVLAGDGRIGSPGDIYFLALDEARVGLRGVDLKDLVARRRREYDRELQRRYVPRLLLSDGTDVEAAAAAAAGTAPGAGPDAGVLTGSPASAGTVTGKARVILDPVGARLEPGEILVAPSTDPGWTPLFMTAGALVMEMGGSISHGAVVAREYGIPAVVGVPDATLRLETGQTITVDGAAGTVAVDDAAGGPGR